MDWGATNNSKLVNWSDRATPTSPSQASGKGGCAGTPDSTGKHAQNRSMVYSASRSQRQYVRNFAVMVRDRLDPSLKVHVEYSNEVWNSMFSQAKYAGEKGLERRLDDTSWGAGLRYYSGVPLKCSKFGKTCLGQTANSDW